MISKSLIRVSVVAAVVALNSWAALDTPRTDGTEVAEAKFSPLPGFKTGEKTYDSLGKWNGCKSAPKKECVMMSIPFTRIYLSDDGILLD